MDYYVFKDYKEDPPKKLNTKKVTKLSIIVLVSIIMIVLIAMYVGNYEFRSWTDKYIFGKEMTENTGAIIEVDSESNSYVYAYDKYISVLNKNHLQNYTSSGTKDSDLEISISNPIFSSSGKYLCIAEKGGNKIYLVSGEHIIWQKDLENEIAQINVNRNGYVSVSHKSIVKMFNREGKDLTTAYLSSTYAICTAVSEDNEELAIAEINYTGSLIQSSIKIISVDKAQNDPDNAVIYTYKADKKAIITDIKYQGRNTLVCMFDGQILKRVNEEVTEEAKFDQDTLFADINLNGYLIEIRKNKSGLFSQNAEANIKQIGGTKTNLHILNMLPKAVSTCEDIIAINMGTEVDFIGTNGWLIKKYTSSRNIKNVVVSNSIAGIVYKDKIEIISL